ncbi:MAG: alpha/beta fold hydrolase [Acidimicrobiales bacterium]
MQDIAPPQCEGTVSLPDGRRLGYAEFGDPGGTLVLWCPGTPGARRQVPPVARTAAETLGLRVVCVERPGVGLSTDHAYDNIRGWADDAVVVADSLGHERFMAVGLSGGGPYALAVAHDFPDRVIAAGILASVVPVVGEERVDGGLVALSVHFNRLLTTVKKPVGTALWGVVRAVTPVAHYALVGFAGVMPAGDRRVLLDPQIEAMLLDDLVRGGTAQFRAVANDAVLFGRHWGFHLGDISVPVLWWHGDADPFVPLAHARHAVAFMPTGHLLVRHGESHLADFATADEVLTTLVGLWNRAEERSAEAAANDRVSGSARPQLPD